MTTLPTVSNTYGGEIPPLHSHSIGGIMPKDYDPLALSVVDQKNQIGLTNSQHDDVIEQYVELVVDRMETQDLVEYVTNDLLNRFAEMNSIDFKEYVNEVEDGISEDNLFDELVDNVTQQYPKQLNTFGG